jgi:hypothetical protein
MTKPMVAFCNFANAPKKTVILFLVLLVLILRMSLKEGYTVDKNCYFILLFRLNKGLITFGKLHFKQRSAT